MTLSAHVNTDGLILPPPLENTDGVNPEVHNVESLVI